MIFGAVGVFFFAADVDGAEEGAGDECAEVADEARGGISAGVERAAVPLDPVEATAAAGSFASPDAYDVSCALRAA